MQLDSNRSTTRRRPRPRLRPRLETQDRARRGTPARALPGSWSGRSFILPSSVLAATSAQCRWTWTGCMMRLRWRSSGPGSRPRGPYCQRHKRKSPRKLLRKALQTVRKPRLQPLLPRLRKLLLRTLRCRRAFPRLASASSFRSSCCLSTSQMFPSASSGICWRATAASLWTAMTRSRLGKSSAAGGLFIKTVEFGAPTVNGRRLEGLRRRRATIQQLSPCTPNWRSCRWLCPSCAGLSGGQQPRLSGSRCRRP
mmetsp:Transcript_49258/g.107163  ORF Transcript_49258/g.107163 Transcript_49258/m.107163 type:complete len:254 (+) Transcript_49258:887-1648(+)